MISMLHFKETTNHLFSKMILSKAQNNILDRLHILLFLISIAGRCFSLKPYKNNFVNKKKFFTLKD